MDPRGVSKPFGTLQKRKSALLQASCVKVVPIGQANPSHSPAMRDQWRLGPGYDFPFVNVRKASSMSASARKLSGSRDIVATARVCPSSR
jgi:hypothetical protein